MARMKVAARAMMPLIEREESMVKSVVKGMNAHGWPRNEFVRRVYRPDVPSKASEWVAKAVESAFER